MKIGQMCKKVKCAGLGIMLIAAGIVFLSTAIDNVSAGATITVDNQGGGNYYTISAAIQNANAGDIILVNYGSGTYTENINIDKALSLIGIPTQGGARPTITAQTTTNNVITITEDPVTQPIMIESFCITGSQTQSGIYSDVTGSENNDVLIQYCSIYDNYNGIYLGMDSCYHIINSCNVYNNDNYGIYLNGQYHDIMNCGYGYGTTEGIYDNGWGIYGISLEDTTISDTNVYSNTNKGIFITDSNDNTFEDVKIWNNGGEGLTLTGDNNYLYGSGVVSILNNNYNLDGTSQNPIYDITIGGTHNIIDSYDIQQTSSGTYNMGIRMCAGSESYPNIVQDCEVTGYTNTGCIGVILESYSKIMGYWTYIHDNRMGCLIKGTNCEIDCEDQYQVFPTNFEDNEYAIKVTNEDTLIKNMNISNDNRGLSVGIIVSHDSQYYDCGSADMRNIKIFNTYRGVYLINLDANDLNRLTDSRIEKNYDGVYMVNSVDVDVIDTTIIYSSNYGIYCYNCESNCFSGGEYRANGGNDGAGIYLSETSTDNLVSGITFTHHYKSVWIDGESTQNTVFVCDFNDYTGDNKYSVQKTWGDPDVEIGIFITGSSHTQTLYENDFAQISYCFGIVGCDFININGDQSNPPVNPASISGSCNAALYATYNGDEGSSGNIFNYYSTVTTETKVFLYGYQYDYTDFEDHSGLTGTTWEDYGNNYYYWD